MVKFESFNLSEPTLRALADMGFESASPIQEAAIPVALAGRDVIGQAQTGTGKTAAFGIPLVEAAMAGRAGLVLVPTRELAQQVAPELDRIGKHAGVRALALYGGAPFGPQARALDAGGAQLIVATPGRLRDHIERGTLEANAASLVVLDEADEMLKMGFLEEVEAILEAVGADRQTLLFSATMPEPILHLAHRHMRDPEIVQVWGASESVAADNTEQLAVEVPHAEKLDALLRIVAVERPTGMLVFRHTRETVDELVQELRAAGLAAEALHGGMPQGSRDAVLARLRSGRLKVLVATNVAARGLDVDTLSHVVNYDAPREAEAYVHRIGRTGRAGRSGKSFLFVAPSDRSRRRGIERALGTRLSNYEIPTDDDVRASASEGLVAWLLARPEAPETHLRAVDAAIAKGADPRQLAAAALAAVARHEGLEPPAFTTRRVARAAPAPSSRSRSRDGPKVAVLFAVGRDDGVRPGDLVGAIANEGGLTGSDVGRIDVLPRMAVAEIPEEGHEEVLAAMARTTVRGRPANVRVAHRWQFRSAPSARGSPARGGPRRG